MKPLTPMRLAILFAALALYASVWPCHATSLTDVWQLAEAHAPALEQADATLEQARTVRSRHDLHKPELSA